MLLSNGSVVFDPDAVGKNGTGSSQVNGTRFEPYLINNTGSAVGDVNHGSLGLWDGSKFTNLTGYHVSDLNDQTQLAIGNAASSAATGPLFDEGGLWENAQVTVLRDTLPPLIQFQYWNVQPFSISNQVAGVPLANADATIHLIVGGSAEYLIFSGISESSEIRWCSRRCCSGCRATGPVAAGCHPATGPVALQNPPPGNTELNTTRNPSRWEVSYKDHFGPDNDNGNAYMFANDMPSAKLNEFYYFDDPGIHYDTDTENDPDHISDIWSHVGDYVYCEKVFSYKIQYSFDKSGWTDDNADWKDGVEMFVPHKLLAQLVQKTVIVQDAWKGLLNEISEGKINPHQPFRYARNQQK